MATWTDGAAYAPIERPDGFATPEVAPLEAAPPQQAPTPGPMSPPQGFAPQDNVVPLAAIRSEPIAERDPSQPFEVSAALLTAQPSSGQERDPLQPFTSFGPASTDPPPPSGPPISLATPDAPPLIGAAPLAGPVGSPVSTPPGSVNFPPPSPGSRSQSSHPYGAPVPPGGPFAPAGNSRVDSQTLQLQTMSSVMLGVGFLLWTVSPFMLLVGGGMLLRVPHRRSLAISALVTGGVSILISLMDLYDLAWVAPVACLVFFVWSLINRRPPSPRPWGQ